MPVGDDLFLFVCLLINVEFVAFIMHTINPVLVKNRISIRTLGWVVQNLIKLTQD